jgi:serine/threonine protein phosphatase PrpC
MKLLLISGHKSDIGLVRQNNEDALHINDRLGIYVLADGMGGHEGGEIASNIAVNTVAKILSSSVMELHKKNVGQIVYNQINLMSMATTVVISIFLDDVVNCVHLGDSRAYLYKKDNSLIQLTTDDSLVMEMVKQGMMSKDDLQNHSLRNIVTRYLGTVNLTIPEIQQFRVETNDCIMLCSDGLTNMLNDEEIQSILRGNISMGPQDVCNLLVDSANAKGGQDNISVIVVQSK